MPVCGNYLFFELPKKIVLNPKDGDYLYGYWIARVNPDTLALSEV